MSAVRRIPISSLLDFAWRTAFRLGFPIARIWWQLTRPYHEGTLVAVCVGPALLLVRTSYLVGWHFPGGGSGAARRPKQRRAGNWPRRLVSRRPRCSLRALPVARGTDDVVVYISLSYDGSNYHNCSSTTERSIAGNG